MLGGNEGETAQTIKPSFVSQEAIDNLSFPTCPSDSDCYKVVRP
jgi:hypothetical protein